MKKTLCAMMAMVLAGSLLTGCGGKSQSSTSAAAPTEASSTLAEAPDDPKAGEESNGVESVNAALKIAIVSSPSGVDDGSFNEDNYNGILSFIGLHPEATVTPVREETGDTAAAVQAVQDIVADYDVIVCCGFQFAAIGAIANDNPDVKFILVDSYPTDAE